MAVWEAHSQPLALETASVRAGHIGCGPCLVDKNQPCRIEIELLVKPGLTHFQKIRTALLQTVPQPPDAMHQPKRQQEHGYEDQQKAPLTYLPTYIGR